MIRIVRPQHPDIEEGMPQNAPLTDHNHHTYRRIVFSNKCVCGKEFVQNRYKSTFRSGIVFTDFQLSYYWIGKVKTTFSC